MILALLAALQASPITGPGGYLAPESELRFIFTRGARRHAAKIVGGGDGPDKWSRPAFYRIVKRCGGRRIGGEAGYNSIMIVTQSGADNLRIAECVKKTTSASFRVGIYGSVGWGPQRFDQRPFERLWNMEGRRA